jgi:serine palmitoyltransferase
MFTYSPPKAAIRLRVLSLLTSQKSNHQLNYTLTTKMSPSPSDIPAPLAHIVASLSALINLLSTAFHKIPGSPIIIRYIRSSYQNDPWRSLLEVLLVAFALRTVLKGRTRGDGQSKSFIKFSNKVSRVELSEARQTGLTVIGEEHETNGQEIDDLVDEWQPTPLVDDPTEFDEGTLDSVPMIQGPNGLKVKIQPNGKTVSRL